MNQINELSSGRVFDLLTEMSIDPFMQEALRRNPGGVLARAGLSAAEQSLVAGWLHGEATWQPQASSACFFDPGDDPNPNPDPLPEQPFEVRS